MKGFKVYVQATSMTERMLSRLSPVTETSKFSNLSASRSIIYSGYHVWLKAGRGWVEEPVSDVDLCEHVV